MIFNMYSGSVAAEHLIKELALRAMSATRFKACPVATREDPFNEVLATSAVRIVSISFLNDEMYAVQACVELQSASGADATGIGVAVKGRDDKFMLSTGVPLALRRALNMAFNILGQKEAKQAQKDGFNLKICPAGVDVLKISSESLGSVQRMVNASRS